MTHRELVICTYSALRDSTRKRIFFIRKEQEYSYTDLFFLIFNKVLGFAMALFSPPGNKVCAS